MAKITTYNPQTSQQTAPYDAAKFNVQDGIEIKTVVDANDDEFQELSGRTTSTNTGDETQSSIVTKLGTTDNVPEGTINKYWTLARTLGSVLTGYVVAVGNTAIASSDTILQAFQKLGGSIADIYTQLSGKQPNLVSGTNIKTINGSSVLGSGDLTIAGGGALTKATQSEAEAGTDDAKYMTPLKTAQAIAELSGEIGGGEDIAPIPTLKNWKEKLMLDPANAVMVLVGDSTSDFSGNASAIPGIVGEYTGVNQPLDGFDPVNNMPNWGSSGQTLASFISGGGLASLIAAAPGIHLIVLSYGINDVRVNSATKDQLKTMLLQVIDAVTAANPKIDFILRMPNSFLTVSPNGYIQQGPYGSISAAAQAQSNILYQAYKELEYARDNAVLMDTQEYIFGRKCTASSPLMTDEIHPQYPGIVEMLVGIVGYKIPFKTAYSDASISANFAQPWTVYSKVLHDTRYYKELIKGRVNFIGSTFLDVSCDPYTMQNIFPNDIISIGDKFFFNRAEANALNDGVLRISFESGTLAGNTVTNGTVAIYRSLFNNTPIAQRYVKDTKNYPYRRYVSISTVGTYLYLGTQGEGLYPYLNALRVRGGSMLLQAGDVLIPEGATEPIILNNGGGVLNADQIYIDQGVDVSSANGKIGMLFGNHLYEV